MLVVKVVALDAHYRVLVAYGTSQKTSALRRGEFLVRKEASNAFKLSGLSFDTKFSFAHSVELDFAEEWFTVPPGAPHGQTPKIGTLHAVYGRAAHAAYLAMQP